MDNLTQPAQDLISSVTNNYREKLSWQNQPQIHSGETISFVAFAYERLRNFVDYQEEHLLRRRAITRALTRRLIFAQPTQEMALGLVMELIRSRYLPNNTLPQKKIPEVVTIIDKYQNLIKILPNLRELLIAFCGREIEESLTLDNELPLVLFAHKIFKEKLLVKNDLLLFLAIEEILSRADEETKRYHLMKLSLTDWQDTDQILKINKDISQALTLPEKEILIHKIRQQIAPFVILRDLIAQNEGSLAVIFNDPILLEKTVSQTASLRYRRASANLKTAVIQSFIYIFLTKMIFAFLLEAPYDLYVVGHIKLLPFIINLLFPPFFMILTTQTVTIPGVKNTLAIIKELKKDLYPQSGLRLPQITLDLLGTLRPTLNLLFKFFYFLTFVFVFGTVIYFLNRLQFSFISMAVFFFFVSTVAFFAFRIRRNFGDLRMNEEKETLLNGLFNFISYPFIRLGLIFSQTLSHFNILIIILDLIIEAPLKTLFELIEEWFAFIRRKQEEIL